MLDKSSGPALLFIYCGENDPSADEEDHQATTLRRLDPVICPTSPKTKGPMIPANFELTS